MELKEFTVGKLMVKSYLVSENNSAFIIDPGAEGERLYNYLKNHNLELKYIINTHGHFDHIAANDFLKKKTDADILAHPDADLKFKDPKLNLSQLFMNQKIKSPALDRALTENEEIIFENLKLKIIYTPGHSQDGISIYLPAKKILFSGDCIFANGIGRTDLEDSDSVQLKNSIEKKLFKLPDDCTFYPGHGSKSTLSVYKSRVWPAIS
ncbi:glyoxylase-like metal-dependent hydrolase (beta-lactamase superfamily II) [Halanaerobium saccharolyticum]|uniref:Glyoxylase-like metal-dependent hydrolase (Beta-lactamase superfamily II) n=1 Tax=Halanaerobium saccharolyticum TaxID=43595 RepID=A0A4R7Z384_9FIRM|nr:MBL fold metallo-hydrolase [Halanaerobium saccharolyticum]RAK10378.1 glyoxylase-like metal-dependent hydrolase (beta-lactamase superfamily II) [Halanaerobium saccharolyticum]TDW05324.1 glyoxylase-like metal-dependent hydrolase (beta-lactamase superfamily II) [Halanaerobium saccharolyticum]TDX60394.1 glyoxylase-like metal-dependent hydrolase (beta-lactamase superfamily II) [Halanaerobium saccharolyticum]